MAKLNAMGYIVVLLIIGLLGAVFLQQISTDVKAQTDYLSVTNESQNFASARLAAQAFSINSTAATFSTLGDPSASAPVRNFVLRLNNGTILVNGTHYNLNSIAGTYSILNTSVTYPVTNNITKATYDYPSANYIEDNATRNLTDLIPLFFAIGVLVVFVAYQWKKGNLGELINKYR